MTFLNVNIKTFYKIYPLLYFDETLKSIKIQLSRYTNLSDKTNSKIRDLGMHFTAYQVVKWEPKQYGTRKSLQL